MVYWCLTLCLFCVVLLLVACAAGVFTLLIGLCLVVICAMLACVDGVCLWCLVF